MLYFTAMPEETDIQIANDKAAAEEKRLSQSRDQLMQKLKARGAQSMTLKEYMALKAKKDKVGKPKFPAHLRLIVATPILLIVCFGIFYIPFTLYQIATGKKAPPKVEHSALDDIMKKPATETP